MLNILNYEIEKAEYRLANIAECYSSYTIELEKIKLLKLLKLCIK